MRLVTLSRSFAITARRVCAKTVERRIDDGDENVDMMTTMTMIILLMLMVMIEIWGYQAGMHGQPFFASGRGRPGQWKKFSGPGRTGAAIFPGAEAGRGRASLENIQSVHIIISCS